jgi:hypothetical protein
LQAKENKRPFSVFVYSKQKKVCHFRFPFAENKLKLSFSVPFSVVEFRKRGDMDMETWRQGVMEMETWRHRHGDMEIWAWRHGDIETWRNGDMET